MSNQNQTAETRVYPRIEAIATIEIAQQTYPVKKLESTGIMFGRIQASNESWGFIAQSIQA